MESETIIEVPIEKIEHKFYVYYNLNGKIIQITKEIVNSEHDFVITHMPEAGEIISGHRNANQWCVSFSDKTQQIEFMNKKFAGTLRPPEDLLYQIPMEQQPEEVEKADYHYLGNYRYRRRLDNRQIYETDVVVQIFPSTNVITLTISQPVKNRLLWGLNVHDLKNPQGSQLNLYITKKNDPDYLIVQVQIDPLDLVRDEHIIVELPTSLLRYVDYNDISIFTTRLFDSYSYRLMEQFVDYDPKDIRRIKLALYEVDTAHINIARSKTNKIWIKGIPDLDRVTPEYSLQFHVVDATIEHDIESRYVDTAWVSIQDIIAGKEIDIEAPEKFNVLHNYKLKIGVNCESQH